MDNAKLVSRYNQLKDSLSLEAQILIEELLKRDTWADDIITELIAANSHKEAKLILASQDYAKLENRYNRLLDRS